jgi:putative polyhydroxyalkanoate system protein
MSEIKYKRMHHLSMKDAKKIAQKAADDLGREYDLVSEWEGDTLHFHRSGVDGHMHVTAHAIDLNVKLGFLLRPFRSAFEHHIERNLDALLAAAPKTAVAAKAAKKAPGRKKA